MGKKRSSWIRTLIFLMIGGISLASLGVAGFWIFNQFFRTPEIRIIQPTEPKILNIGEGILLASHAKSANGISRVEFLINGDVIGHLEPENENAKEMVAQFPWMPDSAGIFNLSVLAYGLNNQASDQASVPIAVISPNLTPFEVAQLEETLAESLMINVVVPHEDSDAGDPGDPENGQQNLNGGGQAGQDNEGQGNEGQGNEGQDDEGQEGNRIQHIHWGPILGPFGLAANQTKIISLDVDMEILADRVDVIASASAVDDEGVKHISFRVYKPNSIGLVASYSSMCDGTETCESSYSLELDEGDYVLAASAVNISDNISEIASKNFQVPSLEEAEEPDFELVDDPEFNIPEGFFDSINLHLLGEEEEISNLPPYISVFNVQNAREGQNADVVVWATAEDDNGIGSFQISVFNQADNSPVTILSSLCQGSLECNIGEQLVLDDGSYVLIAQAVDIDNNESQPLERTIQVFSNHPEGEPPSILVGRYTHLIPPEAIAHFNRNENGVFHLPSHQLDFQGNPEREEAELDVLENIECIGECEENIEGNTLDYVEVDIWYQPATRTMDAQIVTALRVPPGIPMPEEPDPFIKISIRRNAMNNVYTILPLTPSVVEHGTHKESRINASSLCSSVDFYMDLLIGEVNGSQRSLEQVHIGELDLLQCPPRSPRLLELSTISSYGEQVGHIQIVWESISQPDAAFWNPIDHFLLTEKVFLPTGVVSNVISINYPRADYRDYDVLPDTVYEYSIQVVSINGFIGFPGNYLNIRTPPEGLNSEGVRNVIVSTDWQPNR